MSLSTSPPPPSALAHHPSPSPAKVPNIAKVELSFVASVHNPVSEQAAKDPLIYYVIEPRWGMMWY